MATTATGGSGGGAAPAVPASPAPPATPTAGERIAKWLTLAATIVGIFVTLNTLLSNCSKDRIDRASGFRSAVQAEEKFWSGLYDQYLRAVSEGEPDSELRRTQLITIAMLSTHKNPDFDEFDVWYDWAGNAAAAQATADLDFLRQVLHESLKDPRSSSRELAADIAFFLDEKVKLRQRDTGERQAATDKPPAVTSSARAQTVAAVGLQALPAATAVDRVGQPKLGSHILAAGSPTGWDIDVFWCMGGAEAVTYARALRIGEVLARAAETGTGAGAGISLGRVRLRSLPVAQQQSGYFYTSGDAVVWDDGKGEQEAAGKLAAFVRGKSGASLRPVHSVGALTSWYLSVFVCPARAAAPGGARGAAAEAAAT